MAVEGAGEGLSGISPDRLPSSYRFLPPRDQKVFGCIKQWGVLRQFKLRGSEKVATLLRVHVIAYNLIRLGNMFKTIMATA
jgi:hypothetical protein